MGRRRNHTRRTTRSHPRGVLRVSTRGYAFVQTSEGEFYIPDNRMNGAFDGDLVEVTPLKSGNRSNKNTRKNDTSRSGDPSVAPAARVLRVVDRAHDVIVGRYEIAEPFGVVVPEDNRIHYDVFTLLADNPAIEHGSLVRVRITQFPTRHSAACGVIESVLAGPDDVSSSSEVILSRHKFETSFSPEAIQQAQQATLDEVGALVRGYTDLKDRFVFTIDPADARDFDDALSLEVLGGTNDKNSKSVVSEASGSLTTGICCFGTRNHHAARWRLGIHIADVSSYVRWSTPLDLDARRRATSVYLADRVSPMLPEELSAELCSLKPGEVRRTLTLDVYLDKNAQVIAYEAYPALIRSNRRLTYDEALDYLERAEAGQEILAADDCSSSMKKLDCSNQLGCPTQTDEAELVTRLVTLSKIAQKRERERQLAGGLEFDTVEARAVLNEQGEPTAISLRRKNRATSLVEEAMILANETVAQHLLTREFPTLYRVHEAPSVDSLAALIPVFQEFSWYKEIDVEKLVAGDPFQIQKVLSESEGRSEADLVTSLVLRSLKRAVYEPECSPHFGLASKAYTHFTSPIRRYPDLVVHRMLKASMAKRPEKFDQEVSALTWLGRHCSERERAAEAAARESQETKIIELLAASIGQSFSGVVSGVATYGLSVRLDNTAEGILPLRYLGNEYFHFDPVLHQLEGEESLKCYRLGQRIAVVLTAADPLSRRLDFRLASPSSVKD